jgi:hypothetical protein
MTGGAVPISGRVRVVWPQREHLAAHARPGDGEAIELLFESTATTSAHELAGRGCYVEFAVWEGVCRVRGKIAALRSDSSGEPGRLVGEFAPEAAPQLLQRREHVRAPLHTPVLLTGREGELLTATLDISAGGMLIAGPVSADPGEEIAFALTVGEQGRIVRGACTVVRSDGEGNLGVEFKALDPADQALITLTVFEHQQRLRESARSGLHVEDPPAAMRALHGLLGVPVEGGADTGGRPEDTAG